VKQEKFAADIYVQQQIETQKNRMRNQNAMDGKEENDQR
jgi:hypothetical protein